MKIRRLHVPLLEPENIKRHLASPGHWKHGFSAYELAVAWFNAHDTFPERVRNVLQTAPEYVDATLIDGFFEQKVDLRSPGRPSQPDLIVIAGLREELAVIAVEGKVEESFGQIVTTWNDSQGTQQRLKLLCETLRVDVSQVGNIRYQLIHRTASAIYEAQRYRCRHALMLVHSFSPAHRGFDDFSVFSRILGVSVQQQNQCSTAIDCAGVNLRLAWVSDEPQAASQLI